MSMRTYVGFRMLVIAWALLSFAVCNTLTVSAGELKSEFLYEVRIELDAPQLIGETPSGLRRIIYVKSGTFAGPKLKGEVLPGGGDWVVIDQDGVIRLDVRITFRTDDGALIYVKYGGVFDVSPEILQRIRNGEKVDPSKYYFRIAPIFETAAEKYRWLNKIVAVGVGNRTQTGVIYTVYAIR